MNVIFHTTCAIGIAVLLTDTKRIETDNKTKNVFIISSLAFVSAVIIHGILDYIPHCYPINSKADVILGIITIFAGTFLAQKRYRPILLASFTGSILPDLIDLLPAMINKYLDNSAIYSQNKIFPWHWEQYSGSIFTDDCYVSLINQVLLLLIFIIICYCRRNDFKQMYFSKKER